MGELVKHAVDVSRHRLLDLNRVTMWLCLHMVRRVLERHSQWKVTDTRLMTKGYRNRSLSRGITKDWSRAQYIIFSISSDSSLIYRQRSFPSTAHTCRFTKRKSMIFWTSHSWKDSWVMVLAWSLNGTNRIISLLRTSTLSNASHLTMYWLSITLALGIRS